MNTICANTISKLYSVLSWHASLLSKPYLSAYKYSPLKPYKCALYFSNVMKTLSGSC